MIDYVKGILTDIREDQVVVECNGFGIRLFVSNNTKEKIQNEKNEIKLYSYMQVRDDGMYLYGFSHEEEKKMFLNLISISGIGPKAAITILSGLPLSSLALAIMSQDVKTLSKIKGVGKKTAERIIVELKEKISKERGFSFVLDVEDGNTNILDAVEALCSLGIQRSDAVIAVNKVKDNSLTIEEIVYNSLKSLN